MASNSAAEGVSMGDDYEALIATTDAELLKRAWRNEKAAPEILRYESDLVSRVKKVIQFMEETVEEKSSGGTNPLSVSLYQMDLDRTLFLLRSYLRIRIQKIEKFVFHIQKTEELWNRLSKDEKDFAKACENDLKQHLDESVLLKLPKDYKSVLRQSSMSEEDDMVPEPQLDTFVLCRSKEYLTGIQLEDGPVDDRQILLYLDELILLCLEKG
ncbi:DNA replication complex GINS protein SLD5 [Glycine soja]|nr:DNA replication complex GINS protein SLD5 [Glycine soja]